MRLKSILRSINDGLVCCQNRHSQGLPSAVRKILKELFQFSAWSCKPCPFVEVDFCALWYNKTDAQAWGMTTIPIGGARACPINGAATHKLMASPAKSWAKD